MEQQGIKELQARIVVLEDRLRQVLELYPIAPGQGQDRSSPHIASDAPFMTPAGAAIDQQEVSEGEQAQLAVRAAAARQPEIPDFDPYAFQEAAEGTPDAMRRQQVVQTIKRQQGRKQAKQDQDILNQSTLDIDSQPPEAQFQAAQAFAAEHRARVGLDRGERPIVLQPQVQNPEQPSEPESPATRTPSRDPRNEPPYQWPKPPPYTPPPPDTSTQIPQPGDWRDTPERQARGPVGQSPQQQSFGQMQASFDAAVARQLNMIAEVVLNGLRRVEELECWRESTYQE
jgi:hypothetical protein